VKRSPTARLLGAEASGGFMSSIFSRKDEVSLYNLSDTVNRKLNGSKCLLLIDEAHEASMDSLEWLRVMSDQVGGITTVMAALPALESKLKDNLEEARGSAQ
jgi:DNA transposition AAA+ family ATPase